MGHHEVATSGFGGTSGNEDLWDDTKHHDHHSSLHTGSVPRLPRQHDEFVISNKHRRTSSSSASPPARAGRRAQAQQQEDAAAANSADHVKAERFGHATTADHDQGNTDQHPHHHHQQQQAYLNGHHHQALQQQQQISSTPPFHHDHWSANGHSDAYTYGQAQHSAHDHAPHIANWPWSHQSQPPAAQHGNELYDHSYMSGMHAKSNEQWQTAAAATVTSAAHSAGLFASSAIFSHSPMPAYHQHHMTASPNGVARPGSGDSSDYASQHTYSAGAPPPPQLPHLPTPNRGYSLEMSIGGGHHLNSTPLPFPHHLAGAHQQQQQPQPIAAPQRALSLPGQEDTLAAYAAQHAGTSRQMYPYSSLPPAPPGSMLPHAWSTSSGSTPAASPTTPVSITSTSGCCPPGTSGTVAMTALANRARRAQEKANRVSPPPAGTSASSTTTAKRAAQPVKKPIARPAIELDFDCRFCSKKLAKLTLRGPGTFTSGRHEGVYYCLNCVPLPFASTKSTVVNSLDEEATYSDTLSATVDRLAGMSVEDADPRPPPANRTSANGGITSKKRTKMDDDVLTCDVCRRDVGTGGLRLVGAAEGENPEVTIEVLCAHCEARYLRCSDCGGGGGNRGVGRWRAKEMFPEGRRTCGLPHVRIGTLNDMTYDVWPITTIPRAQLPKLIELCRELYTITIYATLAVPDMMESQGALARSFEEVEKQAMDSWCMFEPLMTDDVEGTHHTRRYVALRWSTPTSRKGKKPKNSGGDDSSDDPNQPVPLIRQGKILAGFILAEWDLNIGSLHVALTMPTGSGESYDAASRLMQTLFRHVRNDVASVNFARKQQGAPPLPNLKQAWSLHMIKRDSRIMSRIESRRGFVPLDDYLTKFPDANRSDFAPIRPVFLPPELLRGWFVFVKRVEDSEEEDWINQAQPKLPHQQLGLPSV
ncbi:hypothetical protein ACM66B_003360 [Microbotryomycetes sp. NB124-2]